MSTGLQTKACEKEGKLCKRERIGELTRIGKCGDKGLQARSVVEKFRVTVKLSCLSAFSAGGGSGSNKSDINCSV